MSIKRPGTIKELGFEVGCGLCDFREARPTYQEASILLSEHLDVGHAGWDAEQRAALDRCPGCGKERPKERPPGPPPIPGQYYCVNHRHLIRRSESPG
jgi:hypothetical protein